MPIQSPQWTEFLSCPVCYKIFDVDEHKPISLGCGHTVCKICLTNLTPRKCPFDSTQITRRIQELPVNFALLQLVGVAVPEMYENVVDEGWSESYNTAKKCIEELAIYLKPVDRDAAGQSSAALSRPMQRKLVTLVNCQLVEEEGRARAVRAARSLGERTVTELILQHQNPQQLSANLWAAVRARGCQFLGPAMQEEVLKLILLALEDGSALSRKVLVLFVVQRLEAQYPQASKTAIGHVVQLLYRASCFQVTKRDEESSLMQLKDEFRTYELLRREHDSQIVQIATEAGLRISPEQWSSLLYGDTTHKSHMQSIIDKLQTPQSFGQAITELTLALQRSGDPINLLTLQPHLELLANIEPDQEAPEPPWEELESVMMSVQLVVQGLVAFTQQRVVKKQDVLPLHNPKFKTSMCRDIVHKGKCPRGASCTFAHSADEMDKHRQRGKRPLMSPFSTTMVTPGMSEVTSPHPTFDDVVVYKHVTTATEASQLSTHSSDRSFSGGNSNVSVPIAVPNTYVPESVKARLHAASIYTSIPVHGQDHQTLYPTTIPVTHLLQGAMPKRDSQHARTPVYKTQSTPALRPEPVVSRGYPIPQGWVIQEQKEQQDTVLVMPQHPYAVDRCGLNPRDAAMYNSREIRSKGKSSSEQLEDLQRRRSELVAQLTKRTNSDTGQLRDPHVGPSSASAISHRIYDTKSQSPISQSVSSPDVHIDIAKTHLTFSSQALQATQRNMREANQNAPYIPPTNHGACSNRLDPKCDIANQCGDSVLPSAKSMDIPQTHDQLIGVSVQVTGANAVVHMVPLANSNVTSQSTISNSSDAAQTTTINTIVTITVARTFQTSAISAVAQAANVGTPIPEYSQRTRSSQTMTRPLADSMATTYTTMTLANLVATTEPIPVNQAVAEADLDTYTIWAQTEAFDMDAVAQGSAKFPFSKKQLPDWHIWNEDLVPRSALNEHDEYIPLSEHYVVSKYGPISRMVKEKMKQGHPVQVTAGQPTGPQAVTAVTPVNRPYAMTGMVPSRFAPPTSGHKPLLLSTSAAGVAGHLDHRPDPCGMRVASSLPTALMQPNVIASSKRTAHSQSPWSVTEKMLSMSQEQTLEETASKQDQIRYELMQLNSKIQHLQTSEDERLGRELQAIDLDIQQAQHDVSRENDLLLAQQAQGYAHARLAQEQQDQRYAVDLAVEDAEHFANSPGENGSYESPGDLYR